MNVTPYIWAHVTFGAFLFIHGVCMLNHMSRQTPLVLRLGYCAFTLGVFSAMLEYLCGKESVTVSDLAVSGGLSVILGYRGFKMWYRNMRLSGASLWRSIYD